MSSIRTSDSFSVASIRTMELDEFYAQLRLSGGVESRPLSGRTVRICHTVMRQSPDQARKWGVIARNPARDATPPSAGHRASSGVLREHFARSVPTGHGRIAVIPAV